MAPQNQSQPYSSVVKWVGAYIVDMTCMGEHTDSDKLPPSTTAENRTVENSEFITIIMKVSSRRPHPAPATILCSQTAAVDQLWYKKNTCKSGKNELIIAWDKEILHSTYYSVLCGSITNK